jgi:hypothetical protein
LKLSKNDLASFSLLNLRDSVGTADGGKRTGGRVGAINEWATAGDNYGTTKRTGTTCGWAWPASKSDRVTSEVKEE